MGVLDTIKSVLGLGSAEEQPATERTDVTVEHEPDAESEAAVKGVDEPAAAGTDADASTGSMTEEPPEEGAAEPAEAAGAVTDHEGADTSAAEPAEAAGPTPEGDEDAGAQQVTVISGIGSAYAERLGEAGVETVGDLAEADAAELAEATDIGEARIQRWIDDAAETR